MSSDDFDLDGHADETGGKVERLASRRARVRASGRTETRGMQPNGAGGMDRALRSLPREDPKLEIAGTAIEAGGWRGVAEREDGLPEGAPLTPLGYEAHTYWFLDAKGCLFALAENAGKGNIMSLCTPYKNWPVWAWPRKQKMGKGKAARVRVLGNFEAEEAKADLFAACEFAGPYDPMKKVRGRGAWPDEDSGGVLWHLGDRLMTAAGPRPIGVHGPQGHEKAYPRGEPLPPPSEPAQLTAHCESGRDLPGEEIYQAFQSWNWARGATDAQLMTGWTAWAPFGGCLPWRPFVFATGDAGAGKTTLLKTAEAILGGETALLRAEDATEAGVSSTLQQDSVPVLLDELENEADGTHKAEKLVHLARRAASSSQRLRGNADGTARMTQIRSCFLFSAISMPTMNDQDMTRLALLAMRPLPGGTARAPAPALDEMGRMGALLRRQMWDWMRPDPETGRPMCARVIAAFRAALIAHGGHDERGGDTFGYLLAGFWCATNLDPVMPSEAEMKALIAPLHRDVAIEYEDYAPAWRKCLRYLLDAQPKSLERSAQKSVRAILEWWRDGDTIDDGDPHGSERLRPVGVKEVRARLRAVGLRLKFRKGDPEDIRHAVLFVPNSSPALAQLFSFPMRTKWAPSTPDAEGGWKMALRNGDDGSPQSPVWADKVDGGTVYGTSIWLPAVLHAPNEEA